MSDNRDEIRDCHHVMDQQEHTIATLTAENAALTQRVAELEAGRSDFIQDREELILERRVALQVAATFETERDAAMAEAGRLREALLAEDFCGIRGWSICRICEKTLAGPDGYEITGHEDGCPAEEATATTPAAASERRVAEQRVMKWVDEVACVTSGSEGEAIVVEQLRLAYADLAALDAPGGGAE